MDLPQDIHVSLWQRIAGLLKDGAFCWNQEIWEEMDGRLPPIEDRLHDLRREQRQPQHPADVGRRD
jgi:hypothetical protein